MRWKMCRNETKDGWLIDFDFAAPISAGPVYPVGYASSPKFIPERHQNAVAQPAICVEHDVIPWCILCEGFSSLSKRLCYPKDLLTRVGPAPERA
eukprot:ANDGO_06447.mRNA.1 hypothetical protein